MCSTEYELVKNGVEYGFRASVTDSCGNTTERVFKNLSSSKQEVENFILLLKRNEVSYIHLEDIIDDFFFSY